MVVNDAFSVTSSPRWVFLIEPNRAKIVSLIKESIYSVECVWCLSGRDEIVAEFVGFFPEFVMSERVFTVDVLHVFDRRNFRAACFLSDLSRKWNIAIKISLAFFDFFLSQVQGAKRLADRR